MMRWICTTRKYDWDWSRDGVRDIFDSEESCANAYAEGMASELEID